jgi:hypothetical protein
VKLAFLMESQNFPDAGSPELNSSSLSSESLDEEMSGELNLDELAEISGGALPAKHWIPDPSLRPEEGSRGWI